MTKAKILEEEYKWFFETKPNSQDPIYQIQIVNNLPTEAGILYGSTQINCDICGKGHKGSNCAFEFKENMTMR